METLSPQPVPKWSRYVLIAAAAYNLSWGAFVVLLPTPPFHWIGIDPPLYPSLWQCVGMIVGVYGVGYAIAATDPIRHWPIVLVGLLGKVFGPIGFLWTAAAGELPWSLGWTILTNDLAWWVPFGLILLHARRVHTTDPPRLDALDHTAIPVEDVAANVNWYTSTFRCRVAYQDETWALLEFANTRLALVVAEQHPPHVAFTSPRAEEFGELKRHRDGTASCYTRDPGGNAVELMALSAPPSAN